MSSPSCAGRRGSSASSPEGGERKLAALLQHLEPRLHSERYAFNEASDEALPSGAFALIREDEGLTLVCPDPDGDWALISLQVHSSLHAVGLTAALSAALAKAGISANIVAALRHDHLFVPWERREDAMRCIRALAG